MNKEPKQCQTVASTKLAGKHAPPKSPPASQQGVHDELDNLPDLRRPRHQQRAAHRPPHRRQPQRPADHQRGHTMSAKPFTHTVTGRVVNVKRHGHTMYGNPIMSIALDTDSWGTWHRISNDSGLVYAIENPEYRDEPHVFDVTGAGRISGYTRTLEQHAAAGK